MAFRGVFEHTLDAKKRLTLPRPYRSAFEEGVVLAIPPDLKPCVWIARPADYEAYTQSALAELSPLSSRRLELERFFFGNSHDAALDGRERLMLPTPLIAHAKLKERVLIIGAGQRLECWDPEEWNRYRPDLFSGAQELTGGI
jgi:MraZ protein